MQMETNVRDEIDLVNMLDEKGWAAGRLAGKGIDGKEKPDIFASKDGHLLFFTVVRLDSGSSKKKVGDKGKVLEKYVQRSSNPYVQFNCNGYFAIVKKDYMRWSIANYSNRKLSYNIDYRDISEVLEVT